MGAEDTAVGVHLVDDHEAERREEPPPPVMVGQDRLVEHVGVGEHRPRTVADGAPQVGRGVAVIDVRLLLDARRPEQLVELRALVLRQRLGRVEVERGALLFAEHLRDGHIVAERLAGGGRCHHHRVAPGVDVAPGLRLVAVGPRLAELGERLREPGRHKVGHRGKVAGLGREPLEHRDGVARPLRTLQAADKSLDIGPRCGLRTLRVAPCSAPRPARVAIRE